MYLLVNVIYLFIHNMHIGEFDILIHVIRNNYIVDYSGVPSQTNTNQDLTATTSKSNNISGNRYKT